MSYRVRLARYIDRLMHVLEDEDRDEAISVDLRIRKDSVMVTLFGKEYIRGTPVISRMRCRVEIENSNVVAHMAEMDAADMMEALLEKEKEVNP